jgi:hypothetical protein
MKQKRKLQQKPTKSKCRCHLRPHARSIRSDHAAHAAGGRACLEIAGASKRPERGKSPDARRARPARLGEVGGASVIGSGILETAIRLQHVSAMVRQLSRGELAGRAFKTLDYDKASDFASEKGVPELGIIAQ